MSRKLSIAVLLFLAICLYTLPRNPLISSADEIDDLQKQINDLNRQRELSVSATKPLEGQVEALQRQLAQIQSRLKGLSATINQKEADIKVREEKLDYQQSLLYERVRSYYIKSYSATPLLVILSSRGTGDLFRELTYRQAATLEDQRVITNVTQEITSIQADKEKLEKDKLSMVALQADVDKNESFLSGEIKKAKDYQTNLSKQIATLSAKQQALIAAKLASLNIPHSAYTTQGGCVDDRNVDPGFSPRFAMFTYGVPNRVGLNQYGAKGRAEAGQSAEQILKAYYSADYTTGYNQGITIHVTGTNEYGQSFDERWSIDEYLKHLYEMPTNWPSEALKAQAIAARSYALAYTNNGSSAICPSQSCQVVKKESNDGNWQAAVEATKGIVMTSGGSPIKAWFSSTHGGYVLSSNEIGWNSTSFTKHAVDTSSGSVGSFSELQSNAYDRNSPWFYCDWGSRAQYNKTAWLKPDELADIVNVIMLGQRDSGTQSHLSQVDKSNPDGTDTWDAGKVREELRSRGGTPFSSVSDISVDWDTGGGKTTSVRVSGDGGSVSFDGSTFKQFFNLRAPANIQIVGPLFNAEKR